VVRWWENTAMEFGFVTILWSAIAVIEAFLVVARIFLEPSPLRLSIALSMPALLILGALANAIYNRFTTGHMLEAPPRHRATRH
jgi:hypothetical protein